MSKGFGPKSVTNLLESIEKSKSIEFKNFLFALGIPHVGESLAAVLSENFSLEEIQNAERESFIAIDGVGDKVAEDISLFFSNSEIVTAIEEMLNCGVSIKYPEKIEEKSVLSGLIFVITGELSKPRQFFKELIQENGGKVSSSVSSKTSYLLSGEKAGSKLAKAESLGVNILNENDFYKIMED